MSRSEARKIGMHFIKQTYFGWCQRKVLKMGSENMGVQRGASNVEQYTYIATEHTDVYGEYDMG